MTSRSILTSHNLSLINRIIEVLQGLTMSCVCLLTGATEYIANKCPCVILKLWCYFKIHTFHKNWFVFLLFLFCFVFLLFFFLLFSLKRLKRTRCAKLITNHGQKSMRIDVPGIQVTNLYTNATTQRVVT